MSGKSLLFGILAALLVFALGLAGPGLEGGLDRALAGEKEATAFELCRSDSGEEPATAFELCRCRDRYLTATAFELCRSDRADKPATAFELCRCRDRY